MISTYQRAASVVVTAGTGASAFDCSSLIRGAPPLVMTRRLRRWPGAVCEDQVGRLLRQHYGGCVRVAGGDVGKGRGIHDAQGVNTAHPQARIEHRGTRVGADRATAAGVKHRAGALAEIFQYRGIVTHFEPGFAFACGHGGERRRCGEAAQDARAVEDVGDVGGGGERVRLDDGTELRVGAGDVYRAAARGAAGVEGHQEPGVGVRVQEAPARADRGGAVACRVEVDVQVRALKSRTAAQKGTGLVDTHRERAAAGEGVAQSSAQLAVEGRELVVEGRHARAVEVGDPEVILQTLADGRGVGDDLDAEPTQPLRVADAGELQQLRGVDGASAQEYL